MSVDPINTEGLKIIAQKIGAEELTLAPSGVRLGLNLKSIVVAPVAALCSGSDSRPRAVVDEKALVTSAYCQGG